MKFNELSSKPDYLSIQPEILDFWEKNDTFNKSLDIRKEKEITFYDGPPFPTGKPHHGTILVSFMKDMISRYWTMRGYKVPRVWGWDCHGLPIENQAETKLGINDKNEIEKKLGIAAFNDKCEEIVSNNNDAWASYIREMARWVDYDNAYKTMHPEFMESVLWAFKECYKKGLIYRDYRVTPYCTHCETSLSISDTRESDSTRPRQDRWIMVRFKSDFVLNDKTVYLMAWTTTPWTLPSNMCLAVGNDLSYAVCEVNDDYYVACKNTLANFENVFGKDPVIVKEMRGSELLGIHYEPLFSYFADKKEEGAFRVVSADYVGAEEGVGIVHTAPAFGEDDYWTCKNNGVPLVNPVNAKGQFTPEITDFYSEQDERNVIEMNSDVIRFLYGTGSAVADGTLVHNYPHCWRCKRPLIYKAMDAYYFNIGKVKDEIIANNEKVNWIPDTVKHGRFGNWINGARDWNISRNRYWSTPIPIWECECGAKKILGSIDEIYQESGIRLTNLHRQYMDEVVLTCPDCGKPMHRVPEVLDCWFESGSVPFASKHYPFENKEWFESHFPSDFVVEYTGQIRCWFYYLHVLGTALFGRPAFKNAVVHGTILAADGKKLSKSSKNYTDPMELMKKYGTDAFRLYLYQTNAMLLGDLSFDDNGILDAYQQIILPLWNACNFFISYANIDNFEADSRKCPESDNQLDKWVLAKLCATEKAITDNMDHYLVNHYVGELASLVDGITNWYIRRSRRRFWAVGMNEDKKSAYETLYYVLLNTVKLFAPVAPIIAEKLYKTFTLEESVHLADWPQIPDSYADEKLVAAVDATQEVITVSRSIRAKNKIKNRQPLKTLRIALADPNKAEIVRPFAGIIGEELNVKEVVFMKDASEIAEIQYSPDFNAIKTLYPNEIGGIIKGIKSGKFTLLADGVDIEVNGETKMFSSEVLFVKYNAKNGMFVASQNGIVVSLDLTITEELRVEGFAREIIRNIQDARKRINCEIMDKIVVEIVDGNYPETWMEKICSETLSVIGNVTEPETVVNITEGEDAHIVINIKKA